jgi:CHAT domain-containing protein
VFLFFLVGEEQTFAMLLDASSGQMAAGVNESGARHWRPRHETYQKALQEAVSLPDPAVGMHRALDDLLRFYEDALGPLLEPFLPFLEGKHLKIFPRLLLNEVPLHALRVGGKRLVEYCQVSYAQTLGLFLQVHRHQARPKASASPARTLAMICDDQGAPPYQGTIGQLTTTYGHDLRVQQNPSWQAFARSVRHQRPSDILFACHGQYLPDEPAASSLLFGEGNQVSFSRIFAELDLTGCECVTLGACESGLGRTILTAEYLGLPIAFFAAGVRYVIGSLWRINQLTAAILLCRHYELLHDGKHTVPGALNEAQRDVMEMPLRRVLDWITTNLPEKAATWAPVVQRMEDPPFAHPYFWAGFFVAGDV